jgi:hypothetical protein
MGSLLYRYASGCPVLTTAPLTINETGITYHASSRIELPTSSAVNTREDVTKRLKGGVAHRIRDVDMTFAAATALNRKVAFGNLVSKELEGDIVIFEEKPKWQLILRLPSNAAVRDVRVRIVAP